MASRWQRLITFNNRPSRFLSPHPPSFFCFPFLPYFSYKSLDTETCSIRSLSAESPHHLVWFRVTNETEAIPS